MANPYANFIDANTDGAGSFTNNGGIKTTSPIVAYNPRQQGVFALNPLATPKYAVNNGLRDAEFKDTLARIYISLPLTGDAQSDANVRNQYLQSLPSDGPTQALAAVLLNNGANGAGFIDFFMTQAQESFQEVMQIDKVLSDDYVAFFFGQSPPQFQYSGMLLNSLQDDQRCGFAKAYQYMLRGTQLARQGAIARLSYDSVIVSGTMIAHSQTLLAENEMAVPFSFTFLVKEYLISNDSEYQRTTSEDYVQLSTALNNAQLGPVTAAATTGVRTTTVTSDTPAAASAAGVDPPTDVASPAQNAAQQLASKALATSATQVATVVNNVRGVIQPLVSGPIPPASGATP